MSYIKKPTDEDYWQLHRRNCEDVFRFQSEGYDTYPIEADSEAQAQAAWIDYDLEEMGYGPQDLRVMPCCQ